MSLVRHMYALFQRSNIWGSLLGTDGVPWGLTAVRIMEGAPWGTEDVQWGLIAARYIGGSPLGF